MPRMLVLATLVLVSAGCGGTTAPALVGTPLNRVAGDVPLVGEHRETTSLGAYRGKVVVVVPSLTHCREVCPISTGALIQVDHSVRAAGLAGRVAIVEVSVDPWRDTPARLRAYRAQTGVRFALLTGSLAQLGRFWQPFGVAFFPTGKGRSFDVAHTDGIFFVDPSGRERAAILGMPNVHGKLAPRLRRLLGAKGLANLARPTPGWTVADALATVGHLLGRKIPEASLP